MNYTNTEKILSEYCNKVTEEYKSALASSGKNKGELYSTFKCLYTINDTSINIYFEAPGYFKYVEEGRRPGKFPPISSIKNFIRKRNILPHDISEDSLAFLIARKISKEGIEPTNYLEKIIKRLDNEYSDKLINAFKMDLKDEVYSLLIESTNKLSNSINGISN